MKAIYAAVGCVGLSLVLAAPGYAQTTASGTAPAGTVTATANTQANAPTGSLEMYNGKWRASKLVGSNVYNQLGETIGSVDDLLLGSDGKVDTAVLSVGGFLGIGGKLVAIPFNEFKFVESKRSVASDANAPGTVAPAAGTTVTNNAATTNNAVMNRTAVDNGNAAAAGRPVYYSLVLPDASKNSLNAAAGFKYENSNG